MKITRLLLLFTLTVFAAAAGEWPPRLQNVMTFERNEAKQLERLKEEIKKGADLNLPIGFQRMLRQGEDPADLKGTSWPLDAAVRQGHLQTVDFLLANGALLHGGELVWAGEFAKPDESLILTAALIRAGADVNSQDEYKTSPLSAASYRGRLKAVKLLLGQPGIRLNPVNVDGDTPLLAAVEHGDVEIVQALVRAGADTSIPNRKKETPMELAMKNPDKSAALVAALQTAPK